MPAARALSSPSGEAAEDNVEEREKFWVGRNYGLLTDYGLLTGDDQTIEDGEYDNGESFKRRACAPRVAQSPDNHRPAKISSTMMLFSRSLSILNWI